MGSLEGTAGGQEEQGAGGAPVATLDPLAVAQQVPLRVPQSALATTTSARTRRPSASVTPAARPPSVTISVTGVSRWISAPSFSARRAIACAMRWTPPVGYHTPSAASTNGIIT